MNKLIEGGTWVVPRTRLVFKKQGKTLVLIGRTAHTEDPNGPMHPAQKMEYDEIKRNFESAGFKVRDQLHEGDDIVAVKLERSH
jgi:hypothetical protein